MKYTNNNRIVDPFETIAEAGETWVITGATRSMFGVWYDITNVDTGIEMDVRLDYFYNNFTLIN